MLSPMSSKLLLGVIFVNLIANNGKTDGEREFLSNGQKNEYHRNGIFRGFLQFLPGDLQGYETKAYQLLHHGYDNFYLWQGAADKPDYDPHAVKLIQRGFTNKIKAYKKEITFLTNKITSYVEKEMDKVGAVSVQNKSGLHGENEIPRGNITDASEWVLQTTGSAEIRCRHIDSKIEGLSEFELRSINDALTRLPFFNYTFTVAFTADALVVTAECDVISEPEKYYQNLISLKLTDVHFRGYYPTVNPYNLRIKESSYNETLRYGKSYYEVYAPAYTPTLGPDFQHLEETVKKNFTEIFMDKVTEAVVRKNAIVYGKIQSWYRKNLSETISKLINAYINDSEFLTYLIYRMGSLVESVKDPLADFDDYERTNIFRPVRK